MTKAIYRALLGLYPWDYVAAFSEDMKTTFEQASDKHEVAGRWAFVRFSARELSSLVWGVGKEWFAKLTTEESVRGRSLPDLRMMRPPAIAYEVWFFTRDRANRSEPLA